MSGGAYDYVMGVFANSSGELWSGDSASDNSGFTGKVGSNGTQYNGVSFPDEKYYDVYKASSGTTMTPATACNNNGTYGICYGHPISPEVASWYSDYSGFVSASGPWFSRGGGYSAVAAAGIANRDIRSGVSVSVGAFRVVLSGLQ